MAQHFSSSSNYTGQSKKNASQRSTLSEYSRAQGSSHYTARLGASSRRRHTIRVVALVCAIVVVLLLVAGGTAGFLLYRSALSVKAQASDIMAQTSSLSDGLKNGDTEELSNSVDIIADRTAALDSEVHTPLWNLATHVPVIGQDISSVQTLGTTASQLVDGALIPVTKNLSGMKLSELLQDGSVNVELIQALSDSMTEASPVIEESAQTIAALPPAHISQLASVLNKVQVPMSKAHDSIEKIQPVLSVLPPMLGADGQTRTYLIIAQNNSELRATGGLPGSWGTLSISDGKISFGDDFHSILHGDNFRVSATDEEISYICASIHTDPAQVNFTPDFTRVGTLSREYWQQAGNGNVDGVISIDPVFLQSLLALTGGFSMPDGTVVDGDSAAKVLLSDTYWKFGNDGKAQDAYFSSAAAHSFQTVMDNIGKADIKDLEKAVARGGETGRLRVWMVQDDEEKVMNTLGFSGATPSDPSTPVLGVYLNDDTISKISWYTSVKTDVDEGSKNADGSTTYNVSTSITNTITPQEAARAPEYISGSRDKKRDRSDMLDYVDIFAPAGGSISNFAVSSGGLVGDIAPALHEIYGLQMVNAHIHARAGETVTLTYQITVAPQASEALVVHTTPLAQEGLMGN